MDYIIKKNDIKLVSIAIYDDIDRGILIPRELEEDEILRLAVYVNHYLLDLKTGEPIYPVVTTPDGVISSSIYANTMYVMELYEYENATDEQLMYSAQIYENFLEKQEMVKGKKLIPFPQRCLYYNNKK